VESCLRALADITDKPPRDQHGHVYEISNTWDERFVNDVWSHVEQGQAISTSQSEVVLKLVQKYRDHLLEYGLDETNLDGLIAFPVYEKTPYQSTKLPREVRYAGDNKLVFRCKFNASIVEEIKKLKGSNLFQSQTYPMFLRDSKLWIVDINSGNWERAMDIIKRHNFGFDDHVANYFVEVANSFGSPSLIEVDDQAIQVSVRNDDFLDSWLNGLSRLEA